MLETRAVSPSHGREAHLKTLLQKKVKDAISESLKIYSHGPVEDREEMDQVTSLVFEDVLEGSAAAYLDRLFEMGDTHLGRCVDVAVISTMLAIKAGLDRRTVENIAAGSILCNIGKAPLMFRHASLRRPQTEWTRQEAEAYQSHSVLSYWEIARDENIPMPVKKIVLLHHVWERPDLSFNESLGLHESYPLEFSGRRIGCRDKDVSVQIVQAAEEFVSKLACGTPKPEILKWIEDRIGTQFGKAARLLTEFFSPYSVGEEVMLSNGERALVLNQTCVPARPVVRLLSGEMVGRISDLRHCGVCIARGWWGH